MWLKQVLGLDELKVWLGRPTPSGRVPENGASAGDRPADRDLDVTLVHTARRVGADYPTEIATDR